MRDYKPKESFNLPKKACRYCVDGVSDIDYKDIKNIQKYVNSYGKIDSRKRTGMCAHHQRKLATAIKRARIMALLPFVNR